MSLDNSRYVTTGAGSLAEVADSCGYERPNVLYTSTVGGQPGADCQVRDDGLGGKSKKIMVRDQRSIYSVHPLFPLSCLLQGDTAGNAYSGFVIATATPKTITYDFYRLSKVCLLFCCCSRSCPEGKPVVRELSS